MKAVCVINNIDFHNLVIPNVFGEFCKPNYNSFVATFCDGLVHNKTPTVKEDRQLSLVHVQDLCESIYNSISNNVVVDFATSIFETSVSNVLEILKSIKSSYQENLIFPDLDDALTLRLFNTYRSYMFPSLYPMNVKLHQDHRGSLFENLKCRSGGQTFVSFTNPGMVRGNHFHFRKVERFCVIAGSATIKVRKLFEDKVYQFDVNGEQPCIVDMPTLHTHQIQNTGTNELITIFWANEIYNPLSPDTYQEDV